MHACTLAFSPQILSQSEPGLMEPCRSQVLTLLSSHRPVRQKALSVGASSTSPMIQPKGVDKEGSIAFAEAGWKREAAVQECRASGDVGVDRLRRSLTGGERSIQDVRS